MPELFGFTRFINSLLAGFEIKLYTRLGVADAAHVAYRVNAAFALELVIAAILLAFFLLVRATLSVEKPNPAQQIAEMIHEGVGGLSEQIIGHGYERFQAYITCVLLFILLTNCLGLFPGVITPTSRPSVPLGIAVLTFLYYNFNGLRANGFFGYLKQFFGPLPWLAWLMFPIEVVSHLARVMSLTIRLYANMFAGDMVTLVFFSLVPIGIPSLFLGLHIAVSLLQTYIFVLLTTVYVAGAVAEEH